MFKVVADQLKVSDGWVRCGHCDGVFDASAHFQSIPEPHQLVAAETDDQDVSPSAHEFLAAEEPAITAPLKEPVPTALPDASIGDYAKEVVELLNPPAWLQVAASAVKASTSHVDDASVSAPLSSYLSAPEATDVPTQDEHDRIQDGAGRPAPSSSAKLSRSSHSGKADDLRRPPLSEVTFVQAAQRREKAKNPLYKLLAALASMALLAALALQIIVHERDALAARYPALLPVLELVCQKSNCQVNPPRVIEAVMIDSSSFTQTGPDAYQLNVVLKNVRPAVVAMPALEVTLTNAQNEVLIRKVLLPSEFGASSNRLEQAAPFAGVFNLRVNLPPEPGAPLPAAPAVDAATSDGQPVAETPRASVPVTGYRLFAFYP